ncbi:hypothetical protein ABZ678_04765 [Streptomyces hirsutus]|uniref:hypothetical protein n=1 Tax=Streptomyces hirsutus TaxID=35620 RepID=UPI0033D95D30
MEQITAPGEDEEDEQHAHLKPLTVISDYRRRRTAAFPPRTDHRPLEITCLDILRHDRLGGVIHEYRHTA